MVRIFDVGKLKKLKQKSIVKSTPVLAKLEAWLKNIAEKSLS